jgi:hypothetical protein
LDLSIEAVARYIGAVGLDVAKVNRSNVSWKGAGAFGWASTSSPANAVRKEHSTAAAEEGKDTFTILK